MEEKEADSEQTSACQWGRGGSQEAQTIGHKISYKDIFYSTGNIVDIL